jgi:1,4-dihydroxy-2-naphthoyl-CoA hydrolase
MFVHTLTVQLHHTDAYGILFFANQLAFCHDTFQTWLAEVGHPLAPTRAEAEFVAVVVHVESDYRAPVRLGDRIAVHYGVEAVGTTSFTNRFRLVNQRGVEVGGCRIVQVVIDPTSSAKAPIAAWMRAVLATNPYTG